MHGPTFCDYRSEQQPQSVQLPYSFNSQGLELFSVPTWQPGIQQHQAFFLPQYHTHVPDINFNHEPNLLRNSSPEIFNKYDQYKETCADLVEWVENSFARETGWCHKM